MKRKAHDVSVFVACGGLIWLLSCSDAALQKAGEEASLSAAALEGLDSIALAEDGSVVTTEPACDRARKDGFVAQLSDEAKAIFDKVSTALQALRVSKEQICAHDTDLQKSIGDQIKAIHADSTLTSAEKYTRINEFMASQKEALDAERSAFQSCVQTKASDLKVLDDKADAIIAACGLPARKGAEGHGGPGLMPDHRDAMVQGVEHRRPPKGRGPRPDGEHAPDLQKLEEALKSEACAASL